MPASTFPRPARWRAVAFSAASVVLLGACMPDVVAGAATGAGAAATAARQATAERQRAAAAAAATEAAARQRSDEISAQVDGATR